MREHNRFGRTGRAGCVDQSGQLVHLDRIHPFRKLVFGHTITLGQERFPTQNQRIVDGIRSLHQDHMFQIGQIIPFLFHLLPLHGVFHQDNLCSRMLNNILHFLR